MRGLSLVALLAACHEADWLQYEWDDRRILCSQSFDDLAETQEWDLIYRQLELTRTRGSVALLHAHAPSSTVSIENIERILELVDAYGLDYVTYAELVPGRARGAVAIAFDDQSIEEWMLVRPLLQRHHARVSFFISHLPLWTEEQLADLALLAGDGHGVEAHSVNHVDADQYVQQYGVAQYMEEEARPSIAGLRALGYDVTSYAFPFGSDSEPTHAALLEDVARIRMGLRSCPY